MVADLGGGGGAMIEAILKAFPKVRGMLVDRPESRPMRPSRVFHQGSLRIAFNLSPPTCPKRFRPGLTSMC